MATMEPNQIAALAITGCASRSADQTAAASSSGPSSVPTANPTAGTIAGGYTGLASDGAANSVNYTGVERTRFG